MGKFGAICKGIFYGAFGAAKSESSSAGQRDLKKAKPSASQPESKESRVRYPAKRADTAKSRTIYK